MCKYQLARRIGAILSLFSLGLAGCGAEEPVAQKTAAVDIHIDLPPPTGGGGGGSGGQGGGGQLAVDHPVIVFTQTCPAETSERRVVLRNQGSGDVEVRSLRLGAAEFALLKPPRLPFTLHAGRSQDLEVDFTAPDADHSAVSYQTTLQIGSNDPGHGTLSVSLHAFVPPPTLSPSRRELDFGDLLVGDVRMRRLVLRNTGACQTDLTGVNVAGAGAEAVQVTNLSMEPVPGGGAGQANVVVACLQEGDLDVTLHFLGRKGHPLTSAHVTASCF